MTTAMKPPNRTRSEKTFVVVDGDLRLEMHKGPSGMYVASSLDVSGLFTQGRTVEETIANVRDAAKALAESRSVMSGCVRMKGALP